MIVVSVSLTLYHARTGEMSGVRECCSSEIRHTFAESGTLRKRTKCNRNGVKQPTSDILDVRIPDRFACMIE